MERNVDKIKRLERDAEKYRARFLAQEKDLDKEYDQVLAELK